MSNGEFHRLLGSLVDRYENEVYTADEIFALDPQHQRDDYLYVLALHLVLCALDLSNLI